MPPAAPNRLELIVDRLEAKYGQPEPPKITDPLEMILHENVAYLVSDEQREKAFAALRDRVGLKAGAIYAAPSEVLLEIAKLGGMRPETRAQRLRTIAEIVIEEFDGDSRRMLKQPLALAKKSLKLFPGIGDPGAEKILLFSGTHAVLALESNGVRVLVRLGFGEEQKHYAATYRSVQEALKDQVKTDCPWLIRAHQLLRRHGQELCRRSEPLCQHCPLADVCRFYAQSVA